MKIVVRMPNWLGDLVMSTPVLKVLRKRYPEAHITAMCQASVADVLIANPHTDEVWSYDKPRGMGEKRKIIKEIKKRKFDIGVLLTNSISSAWWFFRGNVKKRIGFANDFRSILLTDAVAFPKDRKSQHLVLTYLSLLVEQAQEQAPELFVSEEEKESAKKILQDHGLQEGQKIIGISPGAAFGTAKRWFPDRFREVAKKFAEQDNVKVVCFGHKSEVDLAKTICQSSEIINLVGKTSLRQLLALISVCDVFLANDSGPMHIAAALGTPLVAIFGPTDAKISRPYKHGEVVYKDVSCAPCHKRTCSSDHRCMREISVDEIYQKLKRLLGV